VHSAVNCHKSKPRKVRCEKTDHTGVTNCLDYLINVAVREMNAMVASVCKGLNPNGALPSEPGDDRVSYR
jgi:hypothetical protein